MQAGSGASPEAAVAGFAEPRLLIFGANQGFIVAERKVLFEVFNFSVGRAIACLLAAYYIFHVNYPKSGVANSILLFVQEILWGKVGDTGVKRSCKYKSFINSIL